jgi:hypothetical protein
MYIASGRTNRSWYRIAAALKARSHFAVRGVGLATLALLAIACAPSRGGPLTFRFATSPGPVAAPFRDYVATLPDPRPQSSPYGVNAGTLYEPSLIGDPRVMTSKLAAAAQQTGVGWLRMTIYQSEFESGDTIQAGATIDSARAHGLNVLATLEAPGSYPISMWAAFTSWAVTHFGNRVEYWAVLNEPNCKDELKYNGALYDEFVRQASPIIRNAGGKVVLGEWSHSDCEGTAWLFDRLTNVGSYADIVAMHKYGTVGEILEAAKSTAREVRIRSGKPLWLTEFGFEYSDGNLQRDSIDLVLRGMGTPPADGLGWQKSFVYHLHNDTRDPDYRIFVRSSLDSASATVTARPAVPAINLIASDCPDVGTSCLLINRYAVVGNHFFTADDREMRGLGYTLEGTNYIYLATQPTRVSGAPLVPLYECWSPSAHFLTRRADCDLNPNAINDRTLGYVDATQAAGTVPLYQLYRAADTDYVATTCTLERSLLLNAGYTYLGVLGYVWRSRAGPALEC